MGLLDSKYLKFLLYVGGTIQVLVMIIGTVLSLAVFGVVGYILYNIFALAK